MTREDALFIAGDIVSDGPMHNGMWIRERFAEALLRVQEQAAEAAWKIVSEENLANRTVDRLRPQFEAAFPGVTLP